jgi:hypothetical protein
MFNKIIEEKSRKQNQTHLLKKNIIETFGIKNVQKFFENVSQQKILKKLFWQDFAET